MQSKLAESVGTPAVVVGRKPGVDQERLYPVRLQSAQRLLVKRAYKKVWIAQGDQVLHKRV